LTDSATSALNRLAAGIEYDGTAYSGWQYQSHAPSVQEKLNHALSSVAATVLECTGAGRTDAGVHATGQVIHFDPTVDRSMRSWLLGVNSNLPDDINMLWVRPVPDDFHARYSATARSYRYVILNRTVRSALERHRVWWKYHPLDSDRMHEAAQQLLGEHDFSAFRAAACQSRTPVRELMHISVSREDDHIYIDCTANAFLHHMVRNIVGSLARIGQGEENIGWLGDVLEQKDRTLSGITAPASGLTLTRVQYPDALLAHRSAPR
jgi:tRNA pseudouridine38-40 synthase